MRSLLQRTALAIAVAWLGGSGSQYPLLPRNAAIADVIGPGRKTLPGKGLIDRPSGAAASALLIRHGESTARELREAQRERARDVGQTRTGIAAAMQPAVAAGARGRLHATSYPAPLCPHPRSSRGPPRSAAAAI